MAAVAEPAHRFLVCIASAPRTEWTAACIFVAVFDREWISGGVLIFKTPHHISHFWVFKSVSQKNFERITPPRGLLRTFSLQLDPQSLRNVVPIEVKNAEATLAISRRCHSERSEESRGRVTSDISGDLRSDCSHNFKFG
jgi:hypothetical protein